MTIGSKSKASALATVGIAPEVVEVVLPPVPPPAPPPAPPLPALWISDGWCIKARARTSVATTSVDQAVVAIVSVIVVQSTTAVIDSSIGDHEDPSKLVTETKSASGAALKHRLLYVMGPMDE
jgi:hypothetical protein